MTFSDEELMVMFSAGTAVAFDMLYERYHGRIYRFARACLGLLPGAEDAVQEVFLRIVRSAHCYRPAHPFHPWIFQIAANCLRDIGYRECRVRRNLPIQTDDTRHEPGDKGLQARRMDAAGELSELLAGLEPEDRMLLLLKECEGLDAGAIARVFGTTPGNIRVRLYRIRRNLIEKRQNEMKE